MLAPFHGGLAPLPTENPGSAPGILKITFLNLFFSVRGGSWLLATPLNTVTDPGLPGEGGMPNPRVGCQPIIQPIFLKTTWKRKNVDR